jgi:hypothetical protein
MLLIQYRNGLIQEGILLAIHGNELRIAVKGSDDVMVFRLLPEGWTSERREIVTFDFPLAPFEVIGMVPTPENIVDEPAAAQQRARKTRAIVN